MTLDRTNSGPDAGAEESDEQRSEQRRPYPPPDRPDATGVPSRADSRRAAHAANDIRASPVSARDDLRPIRSDNPTSMSNVQAVETAKKPAHGMQLEHDDSRETGGTVRAGASEERPVEASMGELGDKSVTRGRMPELRANLWDQHPGDYNPPNLVEERAIGDRKTPFEDPSAWIGDINPEYGPNRPDRQFNCADCTRAVERNWRGDSQVSAGLNGYGELNDRTEVWSGDRFRGMDFDEIENRLNSGGHGSSAMIGVDWRGGGGHYFNAINHRGRILAIDGQSGRIEAWPPSVGGLGYDVSMITSSEAIVRDRNEKTV
jgi:Papain fold toxin 1, glutamine deamidase